MPTPIKTWKIPVESTQKWYGIDGEVMPRKTFSERRNDALDKCNQVCHREYEKYLEATQSARDEYFAALKQIDAEAGALGSKYS